MIAGIVASLCAGIFSGLFHLFPSFFEVHLELCADVSLFVLVFGVGMELASSNEAFEEVRAFGLQVLLLPFAAMGGSLIGAVGVALFSPLSVRESLAVASGFGWYSLSGVLLARLGNPSLGLLAFATNVFRVVTILKSCSGRWIEVRGTLDGNVHLFYQRKSVSYGVLGREAYKQLQEEEVLSMRVSFPEERPKRRYVLLQGIHGKDRGNRGM